MAQAIWNLLTEPEATARQVERGKKRASGFTWEESARRTLAVFEDVARAGDSLEVSRA
jgi:glycosyltransferase involved in cell wall biosynthesis